MYIDEDLLVEQIEKLAQSFSIPGKSLKRLNPGFDPEEHKNFISLSVEIPESGMYCGFAHYIYFEVEE